MSYFIIIFNLIFYIIFHDLKWFNIQLILFQINFIVLSPGLTPSLSKSTSWYWLGQWAIIWWRGEQLHRARDDPSSMCLSPSWVIWSLADTRSIHLYPPRGGGAAHFCFYDLQWFDLILFQIFHTQSHPSPFRMHLWFWPGRWVIARWGGGTIVLGKGWPKPSAIASLPTRSIAHWYWTDPFLPPHGGGAANFFIF